MGGEYDAMMMRDQQQADSTAEATAQAGGAHPGGASGPDDKVVDAEFEEVDEKKKKSA